MVDAAGVVGAAAVEPVDALTGLGLGGAGVVPPVFAWPEARAAERLGARLRAGDGLVRWEQPRRVLVFVPFCDGRCSAVELGGGQVEVGVGAGAVVVVVAAGTAGVGLGDCALRAVPTPSQPLSALDIASVLASSDSRERQPRRAPGGVDSRGMAPNSRAAC
jgi:hypothetical protein